MSFKGLWIYLAVLGAVAGFLLVDRIFFPRQTDGPAPAPLWTGNQAAVEEIQWLRDGEVLHLKKKKGWEIIRPKSVPAEAQAVEGVLQALSALRPERVIPGAQKDLKEFGLDRPGLTIVSLSQGSRQEIQIGAKSAVGEFYYLKAPPSQEVYLVDGFLIKELDRDLFGLRDKRVFSLSPDQVQSLRIASGPKVIDLEKTDKGWIPKGDPGLILNKNKVESFLADLLWLKVKDFVDPQSGPNSFGLEHPEAELRLLSGSPAKQEEKLLLGAESPGRGRYARSSLQAEVIIVDPAFLNKLPARAADWKEEPAQPLKEKKP